MPAKTIKEAEFAKLIENIYRSVNISMVNEMKMASHKINIDIDNVLNLVNTKPGFNNLNPPRYWWTLYSNRSILFILESKTI